MSNESKSYGDRKGRTFSSMVIEPFKQMKFGIYIIAISVAFTAAAGALFMFAFNEQYQQVMSIFSVVDPNLQWELVANDVFEKNAWRLAALLFGFIAVLMIVVFKMTHKYYGPLVSVERFVDEITKGEYYSRVSIRTSDELQDLAAKLNNMAQSLENKHGSCVNESGEKIDRRRRADKLDGVS